MKYHFEKLEKKWAKKWESDRIYEAHDTSSQPKWYSLFEFPYPSGDGLHVGHLRPYIGMDIISRKRRMEGYNVLFPIGWDAFGLPTENYAIKNNISPEVATKKNTDNFRKQIKAIGTSLDWSREINTTDPAYYKWTQWMFLKFFEKGLAYKSAMPINWCPKDKIGLANEEAAGGVCDRCGGPVEKRMKEQWMIKITAYADQLLKGLENLDFLPEIKQQQINWIGRSEGAEIDFSIKGGDKKITVFTTRPDTLFGVTYMVLAPEHELIHKLQSYIENWDEVQKYIKAASATSEEDRLAVNKGKTGVALEGVKAINPANKEEIPVWVADYVLASYGTGAIMAVPAHDERDHEFAEKFNLPIKPVINDGHLENSGTFNGMDSEKAKWEITKFVGGKKEVKYKLRDWVFSRQRYWGEPIPIIHCDGCGYVPVSQKDLPLELPKLKNYQPRDDGQSPLASVEKWVNVKCPKCSGPAKRETDTMPNWAGSSWYFLRYTDPNNKKEFAAEQKLKQWMPVDWYNGGMEHTVLHLLYSRFWNRFLYDLGLVPTAEPYKKRTAHGLILAEGGVKMSKSKGNVVNPDDLVKEFGADALRLYEMFMGPFNQAIAWDARGILGTARFLERVWAISEEKIEEEGGIKELEALLHRTIKKVSEDIESIAFNTAISSLMIFVNKCHEYPHIPKNVWSKFVLLLAPFAPFVAEELWNKLGNKKSIHIAEWPVFDPSLIEEENFELIIQVNGKMRDKVMMPIGVSQKEAEEIALQRDETKKWVTGPVKKVIFVPKRMINFVI